MQEHHLITQKTARYYTIGEVSKNIKTVWIACHGYAQMAGEFIKELEPLAGKDVLIVAPEALSRFYTKGFFGTVGATWMTKEDRLAEIDDYVSYLQLLFEKVKSEVSPVADIHILGFSQGCSTLCRWIARKSPAIKALWLCSGSIPDDLDYEKFKSATQGYPVQYMVGDEDPLINSIDKDAVIGRIQSHDIPIEFHTFNGGHVLNLPLLKSLL